MSESRHKVLGQESPDERPALDELFEGQLPALLAYVRLRAGRRLRACESSMDLVQSACREVLADLGQMRRIDDANLRRWLFVAVERKIIDRARRRGTAKRGEGREVGGGSALDGVEAGQLLTAYRSFCTPSEQAVAREDVERIERAFGELPADYREVIVLSRIVGLSLVEVARHMRRSPGAAKILLHRALAKLAAVSA